MRIRRFLACLVCTALVPGLAFAASPTAKPPNVVVILADDLGWADVGYRGGEIATPSLDRLAAEGVRLERFYTAPHCTPTRAMLMTGRDPIRMGIAYEQINPWDNAGTPPDEHFMPESFRAAGYQTALVGKWHLGHVNGRLHPNARGFDEFYGHLNTAIDYWTHSRRKGRDWQRNGETLDERGRYATDLQGQGAARIIRERDEDKPLFLYVAFNAPHNPMQAPEELIEKYAHLPKDEGYLSAIEPVPESRRAGFARFRRIYAAMVDSMDRAVGQILQALDDEGIADQTIVLFASDNGGFNIFGASNAPLKGQKAQTWEGGIRVNALLRYPKRVEAGGVRRETISMMDVFPTLAAATGIEVEASAALDGVDRWESIASGDETPREGALYFVSEVPIPGLVFSAALEGRWKRVRIERPGGLPTLSHLYDLERDPNEARDVSAAEAAVAKRLDAQLDQWLQLHPPTGLRRSPAPHPGWEPPMDWASAVLPKEDTQSESVSDFLDEGDGRRDRAESTRMFIPMTDAERRALAERARRTALPH